MGNKLNKISKGMLSFMMGLQVILPTIQTVSATSLDENSLLLVEDGVVPNDYNVNVFPNINIEDIGNNGGVLLEEGVTNPIVEPEIITNVVEESPIISEGVVEPTGNLVEPLELTGEYVEESLRPMILTDADIVLPSAADGSSIETIKVDWITPDTVDDGNTDTLSLIWGDNSLQNVRVRLNYALSGQHNYNEGDIQIRVPKVIFQDRDGNIAGTMTLGVPEAPDRTGMFAYTEDEEYITFVNTKRLPAAASGMIEMTVKDLKPHTIKDMATGYTTSPVKAVITVLTNQGNEISKTSNEITANVDTKAEISAGVKRGLSVREVWPSNWPAELKPENHEDYVYADWIVYAYLRANQPFKVQVDDVISNAETSGRELVLGYKDTYSGKVFKGTNTNSISNQVFEGFVDSGNNFFGTVYTAFPKDALQGGDNQVYEFHNNVNFTLTSLDDQQVTTTSANASLNYVPVRFFTPSGYFSVNKEGWGTNRDLTGGDRKVEGVYDYALNRLRNNEDVDLDFKVRTYGYGMPWTLDKGADPEDLNNYGKVPYRMILSDNKTTFNQGDELTVDDFEFKSLKMTKPIIKTYMKYDKDGYGYYEDPITKSVVRGPIVEGSFGYKELNDDSLIPIVEVYAQKSDGVKFKVADVDYSTGSPIITTQNGASALGDRVVFPEGVVDFYVETETTLHAIDWVMYPQMTLKATDRVKQIVEEFYTNSDTPMIYANNTINLDVETYDEVVSIGDTEGRNRLYGFSYGSNLEKSVGYTNDVSNRNVKLNYKATATIQTNIDSKGLLDTIIDEGVFKEVNKGVWYDLLPAGVVPLTNTIKLRDGDTIDSIEVIENYKGSGRTLLKVFATLQPQYTKLTNTIIGVPGLADQPTIEFEANYSWESISDLGGTLINNIVFDSVDTELGTINGFKGEPDDPSVNNNRTTKDAVSNIENDELTGLNDTLQDLDTFLYAKEQTKVAVDTSAITSISKAVDVNKQGLFGDGLGNRMDKNVYEGGVYDYRFRLHNSPSTASKNIIIYDSLESYIPSENTDDFGDIQWRGTLQNVDVSQLVNRGVDVKVYYSTKKGIVLDNADSRGDNDLSDTSIWSLTKPSDPKTITGIAIDARYMLDGSEFELPADDGFSVFVTMRAPMVKDIPGYDESNKEQYYDKALQDGQVEAGLIGGAHAYNNLVMTSISIPVDNPNAQSDNLLVRHDYVKVGLIPYNIKVQKVWDDDNNRDGLRPDAATVRLFANNKDTGKSITLNDGNGWVDEFRDLSYQDENGKVIIYTIKEDTIDGYTYFVSNVEDTKEAQINTLVNKHLPARVSISGVKSWVGDTLSNRPPSIKVELYADGKLVTNKYVSANPDGVWEYTFSNLYRFNQGKEIQYSVKEVYTPNYLTEMDGFNITNTYNPYADINVTKTVISSNQDIIDPNKEFEFVFELKNKNDEYVYDEFDVVIDNTKVGTVSTGGTFKLKHGQTATIKNVSSEHTYVIKEVVPKGYSVKDVNNNMIAPNFIKAGQDINIQVENNYKAKGSIVFKGNKNLINSMGEILPLKRGQFVFEVYNEDDELISTAINDRDGNIEFSRINYTQDDIGVHTYKVKEKNTDAKGISYDEVVRTITVNVSDNGDGTLNVNVAYPNDRDDVEFTNTYKSEGSVQLKAFKQIKYGFEVEPGQFEFKLINQDTQEEYVAYNDAKGEVLFPELKFSDADKNKEFRFTVKEVNTGDSNIKYDETEYTYIVIPRDELTGELMFDTSVVNNKGTATLPIFINEYQPGSLKVKKYLDVYNEEYLQKDFKFKVKFKGDSELIDKLNGETLELERKQESTEDNGLPPTNWVRDGVNNLLTAVIRPFKPVTVHAFDYEVLNSGIDGSVIWEVRTTEDGSNELVFRPSDGVSGTFNDSGWDDNIRRAPWNALTNYNSIRFEKGVKGGSSVSYMFYNNKLTGLLDLSNFNTGSVTNMDSMFRGMSSYNQPLDLSKFDTSNVTNMSSMFYGMSAYNQPLDLSNFNTSKVTNMSSMFYDMNLYNQPLDLSNFDTSSVTNMSLMFYGMRAYDNPLDLSNFDTSKVTNMSSMFRGMSAYDHPLDLSNFDTSRVTNMSSMFYGMSAYNQPLDLSNFNTSKVTTMDTMFSSMYAYDHPLNLSNFDTSNVTNMSYMFRDMRAYNHPLDLSNFNTSKVTTMRSMFSGMNAYNHPLDLSNFDTSRVNNMNSMFRDMRAYTHPLDLSNFDTSRVTNMGYMFYGMSVYDQPLDLSKFDTSRVTTMDAMFYGMRAYNQPLDLSSFDTSNVTNMSFMFMGMSKYNHPLDVSNFDTSNVTNMRSMFRGMSEYNQPLDLSSFDTSKVTTMDAMFKDTPITKLTVSGNFTNPNDDLGVKMSNTALLDGEVVESTGRLYNESDPNQVMASNDFNTLYNRTNPNRPTTTITWLAEPVDNRVTVKFNSGDGAGNMSDITVKKGEDAHPLPQNTFYKFNHLFKGWGMETTDPNIQLNNESEPKTVTINSSYSSKELILTAIWEMMDNSVVVKDGEIEFTLKPYESITIPSLPAGLGYEVYEETEAGWVLVESTNDVGLIEANKEAESTFTNKYDPNSASVRFIASKLMDGVSLNAGGYRFQLKGDDGQVIEEVVSNEVGSVVFTPFHYTQAGQYRYIISEVEGSDTSINYDDTVYEVVVDVLNDGEGNLVARVSDNASNMVFNNTTKANNLTVRKVVDGSDDVSQAFSMRVVFNEGTSSELIDEFMLTNGDVKEFSNLPYGTTYRVEEYDIPKHYKLEGITNGNGVVSGNDVEVVVSNKYEVVYEPVSVQLRAKKVLESVTGRDLVAGEFMFDLIGSNNEVISSVSNDGMGQVVFDLIEFTKPGIYNYTMREVKGSDSSIVYDESVHNISIEVSDVGGRLVGVINYGGSDEVVFTNTETYVPDEDVEVSTIQISKDVSVSTSITESDVYKLGIRLISNDGSRGSLLGEYKYTTNKGRSGYISDGGELTITKDELITVEGLPVGTLVEVVEDVPNGYELSSNSTISAVVGSGDIALTNIYKPEGSLELSAVKRLMYRNVDDYQFTFELLNGDGSLIEQVESNGGSIAFSPIEYTVDDIGKEYVYRMREVNDGQERIQYDSIVYEYRVKVTDIQEGEDRILNAEVISINANKNGKVIATDADGVIFTNIYERDNLPATGTYGLIINLVVVSILVLVAVSMGKFTYRGSNNFN